MEFLLFVLIVAVVVLFISQSNFKKQVLYRLQKLEANLKKIKELKPEDGLPQEPPPLIVEEDPAPVHPLKSDFEYRVSSPRQQEPVPNDKAVHQPAGPEMLDAKSFGIDESIKNIEPPAKKKESDWAIKWHEFKKNVDWEQFTGIKLFAWLGGLCLFIAAGFFVKFSIDRNLIPMGLRLAFGGITGIILIIAAQRFKDEKYTILRHTFVAGGIGVLYSIVYASFLYGYLVQPVGFGLLVLVSAAAFVLAVYHKGVSISVLGAMGAYLTPLLVSTGSGNILMLFIYLSIVNVGLYQVVRYLKSNLLLLVASVGTCMVLGAATGKYNSDLSGLLISSVWSLNLAVISIFLGLANVNPDEDSSIRWAGTILYVSTLLVSVLLLYKSGWGALLLITVSVYGAVALAYRNQGWYSKNIPFSAITFFIALIWTVLRFTPQNMSISFLIFLLYGVAGGFGPILLVWKYGINRMTLVWLKLFPVAVVSVSLLGFIHGPDVSALFWPMVLALQLVGISISLLFAAFLQVALLILLLIGGGLYWIFSCPLDAIGIGFYIFLLLAGILSCSVIYLCLKKLPDIIVKQGKDFDPVKSNVFFSPSKFKITNIEQWITAAPVMGAFLLLAAAFSIDHPYIPHAGMATMICFLGLTLFLSFRIQFQPPAIVGLLSAIFAQAVWILNPKTTYLIFSGVTWSASLFCLALIVPFILYKDLLKWKEVFNAWAIFEVFQGIFLIYSAYMFWDNFIIKWLPLGLAVLKLPGVIILLNRLEGRIERNSILAFHGGTLLFYLSMLPVLVLDHGWIGLTFVFEAAALLWLNRRIIHPGLRWVSMCMAPVGLVILLISVPDLKGIESKPILNPACLAVALSIIGLSAAVKWSSFPDRKLGKFDLHNYFLWLVIGIGFYFLNMINSDIFGGTGQGFKILPGRDFIHSFCYALTWAGFGALLWKIRGLNMIMRFVGFAALCIGSGWLILLPIINPHSVAEMRPLFNISLVAYLPLMGLLFFIFRQESWDSFGGVTKNIFLALFLAAAFMLIKIELSTILQTGYNFDILLPKTGTKAVASAFIWMIYGLGLLLWPKRLDRPFRLAGIVLIFIGIVKGLIFPFRFRADFGDMIPIINIPSAFFLFIIGCLIYLTLRNWKQPWPLSRLPIRSFCGITLGITSFIILNIEIASAFAIKGRMFSMLSHGSLPMQLAYSISWMLFAVIMLIVGIKWDTVRIRWAGILLLVGTSVKIFVLDLWKLGQLYRVGSFVGLAIILILVSFLYQRFLLERKPKEAQPDKSEDFNLKKMQGK